MRRDIFQAIADPTRRAIVSLVIAQAMTPNAIAEHFDTSRQAVSKHIRVLRECGLLRSDLIGRERFYRAEAQKLKEVFDWLSPFRSFWEDRFAALDGLLETMKSAENQAASSKKRSVRSKTS